MIVSSLYVPPASYFVSLLGVSHISVDIDEPFLRKGLQNRCEIVGANGRQTLTIPLQNARSKSTVGEKRISAEVSWQKQHWRAISSGYGKAPFFFHYKEDFEKLYARPFLWLTEFNSCLLNQIFVALRWPMEISIGKSELNCQEAESVRNDTRFIISPYIQVFSDRHGFMENLSVFDLLFNMGPMSLGLFSGAKTRT